MPDPSASDRPPFGTILRTRARFELDRLRMRLDRSCPFCRGRDFQVDYEYSPVLHIRRCDACGLAWTHPLAGRGRLEAYYSDDYRVAGTSLEKVTRDYPVERLPGSPFDRTRELDFLTAAGREGPNLKLLDVGCSWGFLLAQAQQRGFETSGVEVSRPDAEYAREQLGLSVFSGQLEDARLPSSHFDVVTAIHSFEHMPDPLRSLREVHRILRPGGLFLAIVPNYDSYLRRALHKDWEWLTPRDHYFHFSAEVIRHQAGAAGFQVSLQSEEGHYGPEALADRVPAEEIPRRLENLEGSELIVTATADKP